MEGKGVEETEGMAGGRGRREEEGEEEGKEGGWRETSHQGAKKDTPKGQRQAPEQSRTAPQSPRTAPGQLEPSLV